MANELVQGVVIRVRADGTLEVTKLADEFKKAETAGRGMAAGTDQVSAAMGKLSAQLIAAVAGFVTLDKIVQGFSAGIRQYDAIKTMGASLSALLGSAKAGADAMGFFEEAQKKTRATGTELAQFYQELLPLALRRGFDPTALQQFVVGLTQVATATGRTASEMTDAFNQMLTGHVRARNSFLTALGVSSDDFKNANEKTLGDMAQRFLTLEKAGEGMGQSFESMSKHVKEALLDAFAGGMTGAEGSVRLGMDGILKALTNPEMLLAVHNIGKAFADLLPTIAKVVEAAAALATLPGKIGEALAPGSFAKPGQPTDQELIDAGVGMNAIIKSRMAMSKKSPFLFSEAPEAWHTPMLTPDQIADNATLARLKEIQDIFAKTQKAILGAGGAATDWVSKLQLARDAEERTFAPKLLDPLAEQLRAVDMSVGATIDSLNEMQKAMEKDRISPALIQGVEDLKQKTLGDALVMRRSLEDVWNTKALEKYNRALAEIDATMAKIDEETRHQTAQIAQMFGTEEMRFNPFAAAGLGQQAALAQQQQEQLDAIAQSGEIFGINVSQELDAERQKWHNTMAEGATALEKAAQKFDEQWTNKIGPLFADLALTGGKNFGQIAGAMFVESVNKGSAQLAKIFGGVVLSAFGAGPVTMREGETQQEFDQRLKDQQQQQAQLFSGITGAVGAISQGLTLIKQAQAGKAQVSTGDILTMAASFAVVGAQIAGLIGAAVGAVVGALMGVLAQSAAQKKLPYGQYGISGGQAYLTPVTGEESKFANITALQQTQMLEQMQSTFEAGTNLYLKILLKFPAKIVSGLLGSVTSLDFPGPVAPYMKLVNDKWAMFFGAITGGVISAIIFGFKVPKKQQDVSANWMSDFNLWVTDQLPKAIAATFKAPLTTAFTAMGMTTARFTEIWTKLQGMDPKEAGQILSDMADTLIGWDKLTTSMKNLQVGQQTTFDIRSQNFGIVTKTGEAQGAGVNDFAQSLLDQRENLAQLGIAIATLTGKDQVAAANQLQQVMNQTFQSLVTYLNQINSIARAMMDDMRSRILAHDVAQAATPEAKATLLQAEYDRLTGLIQNAAKLGLNPADVQKYTGQAANLLDQIFGLNPSKKADEWWHAQMLFLSQISQNALQSLAQQGISQFQTMIDAMQPFMDFFTGHLDAFGNKLDDLGHIIDGITGNKDQIPKGTQPVTPVVPGIHPPRGGSGVPETQPSDSRGTQSVTVNVYAAEGQSADEVAHSVISALRRNPRLATRPF